MEYLARFPDHPREVAAAFDEPGSLGEAKSLLPTDTASATNQGNPGADSRPDGPLATVRVFGDYELVRELGAAGWALSSRRGRSL